MAEKPSEDVMIRYLLGELPEEEASRLELGFLNDDACYEELLALESELRYDYARGGLSTEQRERFERRFLRSPEEREALETARAVLDRIARTAGAHDLSRARAPRFPALPRRLAWPLAAAAVVLGVSAVWLAIEVRRIEGRLAEIASDRNARIEALEGQVRDERTRADRLRAELEQARRRPPDAERLLSFVALSLPPGLARGSGSTPRRLALPPGTDYVRVELALRPSARYPAYRAVLRSADGSEVWKRGGIRPSGPIARFDVPARLLRARDYEFILEGRTPAGTYEEAGDYYFTVAAPR